MARRKASETKPLKEKILEGAIEIISTRGVKMLTARNVAAIIGYTPGTIYNFYRDMDDLVTEVNYATLCRLEKNCRACVAGLPNDMNKVRALALAYVNFANDNQNEWETLFAGSRHKHQLPDAYKKRVIDIFNFIEMSIIECVPIPPAEADRTARLLWASLHGITILMLDGRLKLTGADDPHALIEDLLKKHFSSFVN